MKNPFTIFEYNGVRLLSGLFQMHDQEGFSLTDSLIECRKRGLTPCLHQFKADALRAGWPEDRIERVMQEAQTDSKAMAAA